MNLFKRMSRTNVILLSLIAFLLVCLSEYSQTHHQKENPTAVAVSDQAKEIIALQERAKHFNEAHS